MNQGIPQDSVITPLLFILYIDGLNKIPEMSGKHKRPNKREKNNKLHSKVGKRYQSNSNNIAQVRTEMYDDDF